MQKKSSRWMIWTSVIIVVIVALVIGTLWLFGVPNGQKLSVLLHSAMELESFDGELSISISTDEGNLEVETELFRRTSNDLALYGADIHEIPFFFSNHRIIFDNGRAFDLGDTIPEMEFDPEHLLKMLPFAGVKAHPKGSDTLYSMKLTASKMQMIFPDLSDGSSLFAEFTEHDGSLAEINLQFRDDERDLNIQFSFLPEMKRDIPVEVWNGITVQDPPSLDVIEPLVDALVSLSKTNPRGAELDVNADCGPIALTDSMTLYSTDSGLYLLRKGAVSQLDGLELSDQMFFALGYTLCRDGRFSRIGDSGTYSLTFPAESVKAWCVGILPEIKILPISYDDASLVFEVKENMLSQLKMDVSGQMPFLTKTINISLGITLHPLPQETLVLPDGIE